MWFAVNSVVIETCLYGLSLLYCGVALCLWFGYSVVNAYLGFGGLVFVLVGYVGIVCVCGCLICVVVLICGFVMCCSLMVWVVVICWLGLLFDG